MKMESIPTGYIRWYRGAPYAYELKQYFILSREVSQPWIHFSEKVQVKIGRFDQKS